MDLDFGKEFEKKSAQLPQDLLFGSSDHSQMTKAEQDHSPNDDVKLKSSKIGGVAGGDDFEHIGHDLMSSTKNATDEMADLLEDFGSTSKTKFDNVKSNVGDEFSNFMSSGKETAGDFMSGFGKGLDQKIGSTRDFMDAERQNVHKFVSDWSKPAPPLELQPSSVEILKPAPAPPVPATVPAPAPAPASTVAAPTPAPGPKAEMFEPPVKGSIYDEFESNVMHTLPVKTAGLKDDNEKFISTEDLLSDFKDEVPADPAPPKPSTEKFLAKEQEKLPEPIGTSTKSTLDIKPIVVAAPTPAPVQAPATAPPTPPRDTDNSGDNKDLGNKNQIQSEILKNSKSSSPTPQKMIIAEEIFCRFGLDAWFKPERLHPKVESLIYWRCVKKSGIVFGAGLVILLAISLFSVISVLAYVSLLSLFGTIAFRIYKNVLGAVQKTSEGHPFKDLLEYDIKLSPEKIQNSVNVVVAHINAVVVELRRLFLVEDLVDSIKFGLILYILTYVGSWFNGMTLVILAFVALFTLPKVYENNKQSIDTYLDLVRNKFLEITDKVKASIPIGKKPETDKDK